MEQPAINQPDYNNYVNCSILKPNKKSFFFGTNKNKKKRKPICTCHLVNNYSDSLSSATGQQQQQQMALINGYQQQTNHLSNGIIESNGVETMSNFGYYDTLNGTLSNAVYSGESPDNYRDYKNGGYQQNSSSQLGQSTMLPGYQPGYRSTGQYSTESPSGSPMHGTISANHHIHRQQQTVFQNGDHPNRYRSGSPYGTAQQSNQLQLHQPNCNNRQLVPYENSDIPYDRSLSSMEDRMSNLSIHCPQPSHHSQPPHPHSHLPTHSYSTPSSPRISSNNSPLSHQRYLSMYQPQQPQPSSQHLHHHLHPHYQQRLLQQHSNNNQTIHSSSSPTSAYRTPTDGSSGGGVINGTTTATAIRSMLDNVAHPLNSSPSYHNSASALSTSAILSTYSPNLSLHRQLLYHHSQLIDPNKLSSTNGTSGSWTNLHYSNQRAAATPPPLPPPPQQQLSEIQNLIALQRQRRWSDGNSRMTKTDIDYLHGMDKCNAYSYLPNGSAMSPCRKPLEVCQCGQCRLGTTTDISGHNHSQHHNHQLYYNSNGNNQPQSSGSTYLGATSNTNTSVQQASSNAKPSRPKVSFGPLMMYPCEPSTMSYDNLEKQHKKNNNNKLTTELLPLDTHLPLSMMGDSAMICNII